MVSWDTRMLSSSGYWVFSQPEICFGDQSIISLLATMFRNFRLMERRQRLGRKADCQASPLRDGLSDERQRARHGSDIS